MHHPGFFDVEEGLLACRKLVTHWRFCRKPWTLTFSVELLDKALKYSDHRQGDCQPYDPVLLFKIRLLRAL